MHFKSWLLAIALLLALPCSALEIAHVEALFAHNKVSELQALKQTTTDSGYSALLLDYRLAAALIQNGDKKAAKDILDEAIKNAQKAIETAPQTLRSEYQVILAALYGLKIIVKPFSAIGLNRKANKALKKAQELEPHNPRALLMLGVAKFQTPALFGGSNKKALSLLQQGLKASEEQHQINWGTVDLHLWLGRVFSELDQPDAALSHYQKALEISPGNHWVVEAMKGNGFDSQAQ